MQKLGNNVFSIPKMDTDRKAPQICTITSGKGGVGKTNLSINIAIALKQMRKKVLLLDADVHLGNVDLFLGISSEYTIADVINGDKKIDEVIFQGPGGIDILPASSAVIDLLESEEKIAKKLNSAFSQSKRDYEYMIVDSGAGLSQTVLPFILGADKVLITVTSDPASIADAYGMIKIIKKFEDSIPVLLVANRVKSKSEGESIYRKMKLMVERFLNSSITYGGTINEEPLIEETVKQQKAILLEHPGSPIARNIKVIAKNLYSLQTNNKDNQYRLFERFIANRNKSLGVDK
ncbi:MAG TPA: AAA family ATPase [bacterium]|nr:AAA family ATPase [bacterium]